MFFDYYNYEGFFLFLQLSILISFFSTHMFEIFALFLI